MIITRIRSVPKWWRIVNRDHTFSPLSNIFLGEKFQFQCIAWGERMNCFCINSIGPKSLKATRNLKYLETYKIESQQSRLRQIRAPFHYHASLSVYRNLVRQYWLFRDYSSPYSAVSGKGGERKKKILLRNDHNSVTSLELEVLKTNLVCREILSIERERERVKSSLLRKHCRSQNCVHWIVMREKKIPETKNISRMSKTHLQLPLAGWSMPSLSTIHNRAWSKISKLSLSTAYVRDVFLFICLTNHSPTNKMHTTTVGVAS